MNNSKSIEQKVIKFINEQNLIAKNDKVLIALSGGPDSVFIIYFLNKFQKLFKIKLGAFHLNHKLRGTDSENDLIFCRELCANISVDFYSANKNLKQFAKKNKFSIEEAGRKIRYEQLNKTAKKNNFNKIATAHIADDNSETVLLNLIKGTGLKGVAGIPIKRGNIIRPILPLTKKEILFYLNQKKIPFRIDDSNLSSDYERNFLRNEIIPLVKERINPSLDAALFNSSQIFRNQFSIIEKKIKEAANSLIIEDKGEIKINLINLKKNDEALWGDLFKYAVERNFSVEFKFNDFAKIYSLIFKQAGKSIKLQKGLIVFRERSFIIIKRVENIKDEEYLIHPEGKIKIDGMKIKIVECDKPNENNKLNFERRFANNNIEYISADNLGDEFVLRRWEHGDKFSPFGMKGTKKVSDFLNEQKIESNKKNKQLVLTNKNKIVWVVGLRIDNHFKVMESTKRILKLCLN